uniref:MFS domain-containing protein n=1 Tax=Syphacia muris TaxID=451379 RepID=A0A0N5AVA0_9BILA
MDKEAGKSVAVKKNIGDFFQLGAYVGYLVLTYEFLLISQVSNLIYMSFGGVPAKPVGCGNKLFDSPNITSDEACSSLKTLRSANSSCEVVLDAAFKSVNYEFGYYCDTAMTVKTSTSFQMIGIIFGAVVFGQLSDTIGRRKTLLFGTVGLIVSGFASTFAVGLWSFTAARFFVMFFTGGKHSVSYVFMTENLPARHRLWILTLVTYSPNYLVVTGIAYLTGEWRLFSRVAAAITIVPLIMLLFVKESPRWLLQKGKIDEARDAVLGIGSWDRSNTEQRRADLDEIIEKERNRLRQAAENNEPPRRYYTYHLFSSRALATYSIFFAYSLMITSIISYGIVFNTERLSGSPYLNLIIIGSLRYVINICAAIIDIKFKWAGRRLLHSVSMASISACLGFVFVTNVLGIEMDSVVRYLTLSASAICTEIYILDAVQPSELFPTAIRNIGIGFIQTFNRIGNTLAPQIFVTAKLWTPLPYLVMCCLSTGEVLAYLGLIPETKGKQMVETMPGENRKPVNDSITKGDVEEKEPLKK